MGKKLSKKLGLNYNALVISITELAHDSGSRLIWGFWPLYIILLGGKVSILGLLRVRDPFLKYANHRFFI